VARPLGLGRVEAALGIHRVVNAQMADGIRLVSVKRGYDPRDFTLVALGGGGGLHAAELARELGIARVLVPRFPGVLSAAGLLAAPVEHELSAALHLDLAAADPGAIAAVLEGLDAALAGVMAAESVEGLPQTRHHFADMAYVGQSHSIEVELPPEGPDQLAALHAAFEASHARINGHATGAPSKIVNLRAVHRAHLPAPALGGVTGTVPGRSLKGRRAIHLAAGGAITAEVHDRGALAVGEVLRGPAILEQDDTTTLLPVDWRARVLDCGALLLEREESA
jgi:N-methylhydantoinase A